MFNFKSINFQQDLDIVIVSAVLLLLNTPSILSFLIYPVKGLGGIFQTVIGLILFMLPTVVFVVCVMRAFKTKRIIPTVLAIILGCMLVFGLVVGSAI